MVEPECWVDRDQLPREPSCLVDPGIPLRGLTVVLTGGKTPHMVSTVEASLPSRAVPAHISTELRDWASYYEASPEEGGWFTLAEFDAIAWDTRVRMRAKVDRRVKHLFADPEAPFPYSEWPSGLPISYAAPQDFHEQTQIVEWTETYRELAQRSVLDPALSLLRQHGAPDAVRIVWWQFW